MVDIDPRTDDGALWHPGVLARHVATITVQLPQWAIDDPAILERVLAFVDELERWAAEHRSSSQS
jgi:hypothetical protein